MHKKDLLSPWHHWSQNQKVAVALIATLFLLFANAWANGVTDTTSTSSYFGFNGQDCVSDLPSGRGAHSMSDTSHISNTLAAQRGQKVTIALNDSFVVYADVARTRAELMHGLSGRTEIAPDEGMFFVFTEPDRYSFWMKDMFFPLDIIWIDMYGHVLHIEKNLPPSSNPSIYSPDVKALFVLEVPAGTADVHGIKVGDKLNLPAAYDLDGIEI